MRSSFVHLAAVFALASAAWGQPPKPAPTKQESASVTLRPDAPPHVVAFWEECQRRSPTGTDALKKELQTRRASLSEIQQGLVDPKRPTERYGKGHWSFQTQTEKIRKVKAEQSRIDYIKKRLSQPEEERELDAPYLAEQSIPTSKIQVGAVGKISNITYREIIDAKSAVVTIRVPGFTDPIIRRGPYGPAGPGDYTPGHATLIDITQSFILEGIDTAGAADGQWFEDPRPFEIVGTRHTSAGPGGPRMAFVLRPFEMSKYLEPSTAGATKP